MDASVTLISATTRPWLDLRFLLPLVALRLLGAGALARVPAVPPKTDAIRPH
jgi:hypothetical protein